MTIPFAAYRYAKLLILTAGFLLIVLLCACGGGGSSPSNSQSSVPAITVTVTPATATITAAQTQQFTSAVTNSNNTAVRWSVQEGSAAGSVSSTGIYTPPKATGTFHVVATSTADATKTATASVTVTATQPVISSTPPTSASEGTTYTYTLSGTDPAGTAITYAITSGPPEATITNGVLTWVPTSAEARTVNSFTVGATTALGGKTTQTWTVATNGIIRGSVTDTRITSAGEITGPDDLSTTIDPPVVAQASGPIAGYVPDGNGKFITKPGTGNADGTFTIPDVPAGSYWLQIGSTYLWTARGSFDIKHAQLGRAGVVIPTQATTLNNTIAFATPCTGPAYVSYFVLNTAAVAQTGPCLTGQQPVSWYSGLPDSSKGDVTYVFQMNALSPTSWSVVGTSGPLTTISLADGENSANVQVPMVSVPQTSTTALSVKTSQFAPFSKDVSATASTLEARVSLALLPSGGAHGFVGGPMIGMYEWFNDTSDQSAAIQFGNPLDSSWAPVESYEFMVETKPVNLGSLYGAQPYGEIWVNVTDPTKFSDPLVPLISPPMSPQIDGSDFFADGGIGSIYGTAPVFTWQPPAIGTPSGYRLRVLKLVANANNTMIEFAADLQTTSTSLSIPPGVLAKGSTYYFQLSAVLADDADLSAAPYWFGYRAGADAISGTALEVY